MAATTLADIMIGLGREFIFDERYSMINIMNMCKYLFIDAW